MAPSHLWFIMVSEARDPPRTMDLALTEPILTELIHARVKRAVRSDQRESVIAPAGVIVIVPCWNSCVHPDASHT